MIFDKGIPGKERVRRYANRCRDLRRVPSGSVLKPRKVIAFLAALGFEEIRQREIGKTLWYAAQI